MVKGLLIEHLRSAINISFSHVFTHVISFSNYLLMLVDDNKIKMARKSVKKKKENMVGCTWEGKI